VKAIPSMKQKASLPLPRLNRALCSWRLAAQKQIRMGEGKDRYEVFQALRHASKQIFFWWYIEGLSKR